MNRALTSSRCTRKVTLLPRLAVSLPFLVLSISPLGGLLGHCCFLAVYISFTPLVQLFSTTLRYLGEGWEKEVFVFLQQMIVIIMLLTKQTHTHTKKLL